MARDNYSYQRYQRELSKKKKKEDKMLRKLNKKKEEESQAPDGSPIQNAGIETPESTKPPEA